MTAKRHRASLQARACWALARANARYWSGIAQIARGELRRWRSRASSIEDPRLRELALAKLRDEGFNAQVAAVLATGVRRRDHRAFVTRAIVALTVLYDFLDGVTELPSLIDGADPVGDGLDVSRALVEALTFTQPALGKYYRRWEEGGDDGGYLEELVDAVRGELARLPASAALVDVLRAGGERCAQAQVRAHAAETLGEAQALEWGAAQGAATGMPPREFLAGAASSVLAVHAVIAGCADERLTVDDGAALDRLYLLISVLPTLLDAAVDHATGADRHGFLRYFTGSADLSETVAHATDEALRRAAEAQGAPQHLMILAGIVAYYASHAGAKSDFATPVVSRALSALGLLVGIALSVVRGWRWGRSLRARMVR